MINTALKLTDMQNMHNTLEQFIQEDLHPVSKLIYLYLEAKYYKSGRCFPRQATIARDMKICRRSVAKHLRELKDRGFIRSRRLSSTCEYYPVYDVSRGAYINKSIISKSNIDISRKISKISTNLGKRSSYFYKSKLPDIKKGVVKTRKEKSELENFLNKMDNEDRSKFLKGWIESGEEDWKKFLAHNQ